MMLRVLAHAPPRTRGAFTSSASSKVFIVPQRRSLRFPAAASVGARDALRRCGILVQGFPRLRRGACGHDTLPTFNGERRGFRP
jgi:hypothetical protein